MTLNGRADCRTTQDDSVNRLNFTLGNSSVLTTPSEDISCLALQVHTTKCSPSYPPKRPPLLLKVQAGHPPCLARIQSESPHWLIRTPHLQIWLAIVVIVPYFPAIAVSEAEHLDGSRKSFDACITHLNTLRRWIMCHSGIVAINPNIRVFWQYTRTRQ